MSDANNAIAIVGMSLRFPKANTPQEFWSNLLAGRDCARLLDRDALVRLGVAPEKLDSSEYVYRGYDLEGIDQFDARFFGISPREARMADPQLRIMLEVAHECIEDSGHVLRGTNTGMYLGVADHKYWLYYNLFQSHLEEQNEVSRRIYAVKDFFPTQLSHKLGLAGPSISLSSACSTGLLATHEACNHLLLFDCDYAIAGGCEILVQAGYQYLEGGLSARDGYVRTFDKDASGTVFGSGVGMVLLRRLEDALADGDRIYAVIRSTAVNNDGDQKVGYMAPGVKGQMEVIRDAIERAGISARDISYVEAHGTGTKVGDPIEVESISRVYRRYTQDRQFCGIGSVKTNVGHLSIAAGMAGLIKTSLMLQHGKIPPTLHFNEANPAIDFDNSPFYVCRALQDWAPESGKRIAGISAFGVGGTNAHAIVEEAPPRRAEVARRPAHRLFVLTGKTETAVAASKQRLAQFLRDNPATVLSDVAYSLNVGRQKFEYRTALSANTAAELIQACEDSGPVAHVPTQTARRTVFMFPGQGSQYANMGLQLYREEPYFREQVDRCLETVLGLTDVDLGAILFPGDSGTAAARERIYRTEYTQVCLFIVCYCLARLWMRWGVTPQAMIGHSIGEYVAACLAGVFSLEDALRLVIHRGRLMQSMPRGSMLSVPLAEAELSRFLEDSVSIAGKNSPASCVVAGEDEAIERLSDALSRAGIKSARLRTSHAFHSHMMDPVLAQYEAIVRDVTLQAPEIPLISNVTGTWLSAEQAVDPSYWARQLREAVHFSKGLQTLYTPDSVFLEVGPGTTLCSLLGQHDFEGGSRSISTMPRAKDEIGADQALAAALGKACCEGLHIDWSAVYDEGGRRISLPTYPFEHKSYWVDDETLKKPRQIAAEAIPLEHPLLGRKIVTSAKAVVFENIIDKDTPRFIADHRLVETVIFPGAGYTQMALEVGKLFVKNKKIRIEEIRFAQVLMLHEGVRKVVQVIATASGTGCTFEILSRDVESAPDADGAAWVLHAKGKIVAHSSDSGTMALPALIQSSTQELLPLSRYYDALKFITFGPSFRAIKRLWIGETPQGELESVGQVELPAHLYPEVDRYSFHPVLLDAAFQVIDGPKVSQTGTLPVGLRGFTVYDAVPNAFYVHAIRRERPDEEYSIGEITVLSEKGQIIAKIEHYLQKEISDSAAADDQLAEVLFGLEWEAVTEPSQSDQVPRRSTYLLVGPEESPAQSLIALLSAEGRHVIQVTNEDIEAALAAAGADEHENSIVDLLRTSELEAVVFAQCLSRHAPQPEALGLSLSVLRLAQLIARCEPEAPPRVVIATSGAQRVGEEIHASEQDAHQAALWGMGTTLRAEHPEYRSLMADLDDTSASLEAFVRDLTRGDTQESQLAYRAGARFAPRLTKYTAGGEARGRLRLPSGPFDIRLAQFGSFDNFTAREIVPDLLADDEVLVEMRSAALNFKETLWVLGYLNPNARQASHLDFGMEGAGRIKRVGARVSHVKPGDDVIVWHNGCLTTDFVVNAEKVIAKPACLSYAEAACVPTVYMTAYYALHDLAGIKAGDKVLIHTAAGGVGQVAVQIAKAAGAEIFATASRAKWPHLRKQGVEHLFDSRTLDFSREILELTHGQGVSIVLNSLAGEFIEKSFDVLAKNGHFVEIGKKEIWSRERAAAYRPDVNYQPFEMGEGAVSGGVVGGGAIHNLMARVLAELEAGTLQALPLTEFPANEVQQAYRYLATGRNVGKVVLSFDNARSGRSQSSFAREDRTYLVTGGLGALGFMCADWLIGHGAHHIVLTGRRAPSEDVARRITDFRKIGVNVKVACGDVGELADVERILAQIAASGAPPLGGILHCAGVLEDGLLKDQTPARFLNVFKPKVLGALHLHRLTRDLPLELFVCFSSVSAILDGGGQGNYAAANAFLDRLMSHRRSQGLPGLSVNWGAWADAGMAARLAEKRAMDVGHFISKDEAFLALERLIANRDVQGVVCRLGNRLNGATSRLLVNLAQGVAEDSGGSELERIFRKNPGNTPVQNLELFLKAQVNKVLGVGGNEDVPVDAEFVSLGVDSLSMTELKNAVQRGLGKSLKMATLFANPSVARLAKHLAGEYGDQLTAATAASQESAGSAPEHGGGSPTSSIELVAMDHGEGERALFCFPGLNGNIFDFKDLAALANSNFRVYVGEMSSELASLETDIRRLAADSIASMKRIQKRGPYALVGYSYGGVIALEIAHQLRKVGEQVELLTMVDSFPHFHLRHDDRFLNFMSALIVDSMLAPLKLDPTTYDRLATQILQTPADEVAGVLESLGAESSAASRVNVALLKIIFEAGKKRTLAHYEPPRAIPGVVINYVRAGSYPRSMQLTDLDGFLEDPCMRDERYSWSQFVDNTFEVHRVDAQHNEILKARNARTVVGIIEAALGVQSTAVASA